MSDLDHRGLVALAAARGGVVTLGEARAAGVSRAALRWAVDSGLMIRIRSSAFVTAERWQASTAEQRHLLQVRAVQRLNPEAVACATTAAVVLGLPVPTVTAEPRFAGPADNGRRGGATFGRSTGGEALLHHGIRTTSAVRTVLDCARVLERGWGLAVADAAVFAGLVTVASLREAVTPLPAAPGLAKIRWVAEHVKPKVESPLESLGRAAIVLAGLPEPEPQKWISTRGGWYRVDMLDELNRVVTEADGKVKYDGVQAVWNEKGRQDDIRDCRLEVVRFTMTNHHHPTPWLTTYRRALTRGRRFVDP